MRIGFCGASGQGKTSTARELLNRPEFVHYSRIGSTARKLSKYGLNKEVTKHGQLMIVQARIEKELETEGCYVSDRTPMDSWAYTKYGARRGNWGKDYMKTYWEIVVDHMDRYNAIFYFPKVFRVHHGPYRIKDDDFHEEIDKSILEGLDKLGIPYAVMPNATIEERADFIRYSLYNSKYT